MASTHPLRPLASQSDLQAFYIGKDISNVPKPAVVLDVAIIKRHCASMLEAAKALGVGFRAHVKTHKVSMETIPRYDEITLTTPTTDTPNCAPAGRGGQRGRQLCHFDGSRRGDSIASV